MGERLAAALVTVVLVAVAPMGHAANAAFVPSEDATVVETLPGGGRERSLKALRAALARRPGDQALALRTAQSAIERSRATGDPRYLGWAQAALGPWWSGSDPDVLLLRATILQSRHEFEAALADLRRVLAARPADVQAWLTRATVEQTMGRARDALASCERLLALLPGLVSEACAADARSLMSDPMPIYRDLATRVDAPSAETVEPRLRAWVHTVLAELAERAGSAADAERHYRTALALALAPDLYLRSAYADFLLDAGRPREALDVVAGPASDAPSTLDALPDATLLRLAIARQAAGDPGAAAAAAAMRERFAAARLRGDDTHARDEARFALAIDRDPRRAAQLAARNWDTQRTPVDARIALEAAHAAGASELAEAVGRFVRDTGLRDRRLPQSATAVGKAGRA